MRRALLTVPFVLFGILCFSTETFIPHASPFTKNGDVNSDGVMDVADVVYAASYLFNGGIPPHRIVRLPKTGQVYCYDESGQIPCGQAGGYGYPLQDAYFQAGCSSYLRFSLADEGYTQDGCTMLEWWFTEAEVSWGEALRISELNPSSEGWRIPNIRQLQTLVSYGELPESFPPGRPNGWVWSSTTRVQEPSTAHAIEMETGDQIRMPKSETARVFFVRGIE